MVRNSRFIKMKKLFLFAFVFIVALAQAQDFKTISSFDSIPTNVEAISMAQTVANLAPTKMRMLTAKDFADDNAYLVRFVPAAMTDQQYNKLGSSAQEAMLTVRFDKVGQSFKFKQVSGEYSEILPFWKMYFRPNADSEKTRSDLKLQKLVDRANNADYYFQEDDERWILRNQS